MYVYSVLYHRVFLTIFEARILNLTIRSPRNGFHDPYYDIQTQGESSTAPQQHYDGLNDFRCTFRCEMTFWYFERNAIE